MVWLSPIFQSNKAHTVCTYIPNMKHVARRGATHRPKVENMLLCFTALCHYELSTHYNGIVAIATVSPDSTNKCPKTKSRDVTQMPVL